MRRIIILLVLVFCLCSSLTLAEEPTVTSVSVAQLIEDGELNSIEVKNALAQLQTAESNLKLAVAGYWPKVTPEIEYQQVETDVSGETIMALQIKMNFESEQLIVFGKKSASEIEEALWELAQAKLAYQAARLKAQTGLSVAYLEVLKNLENVKNRLSYERKIQIEKRQTEIQLQEGTATKLDLLRYQAAEIDAQTNLYVARKDLETALRDLALLTGKNFTPDSQFQPLDIHENDSGEQIKDSENVIEARADVSKARLEIKLAEKTLAKLKNEYRPQVVLSAGEQESLTAWDVSLNLTTGNLALTTSAQSEESVITPSQNKNPLFTAKVSFNLFDAGTARAKINQATESLKLKEAQYQDLVKKVSLELDSLSEKIKVERYRLESQEIKQQNLAETLRLKQMKYREGLSNLDELLEAEEDLNNALTTLNNYQYSYQVARLKLREAMNIKTDYIEEVGK